MKKILCATFLLTASFLPASIPAHSNPLPTSNRIAQNDDGFPTPQQAQAAAKNITVRVTAGNNSGSGTLIAHKGDNYLLLTTASIVNRATRLEIQALDGRKYPAKLIDGGFDTKSDLALLQFTSQTKYTLANLANVSDSPIEPTRRVYSAGFPLNSQQAAITRGEVSQISDLPFANGAQFGFAIDPGKSKIDRGMSGGAILDAQGSLLGINASSNAPNYTYNDGSKPIPSLFAQYTRANWAIPVYNFLTQVKPEIIASYNLPKLERQVPPTGSLANLNDRVRHLTVRLENNEGSGSGVIITRDGNSYYVLTAKYVIQDESTNTHQKFTNTQIITYDQDTHPVTSTIVAEGVNVAIVKFTSNNNYPVAQIGNYTPNQSDRVFVGGYPSREQIGSPFQQWRMSSGGFSGRVSRNKLPYYRMYDLVYTNVTYAGMGGGAVFDAEGKVIGIHFAAEAIDSLAERLRQRTNAGERLGISSQTFLKSIDRLQVRSGLLNIDRQ
jgi:S1-C subfamily serine protease